jgi:hypothetical protein
MFILYSTIFLRWLHYLINYIILKEEVYKFLYRFSVAKKKSKSSPKEVKEIKKSESMVSKVEIKNPQDQEKISRVVGSIFIFLGILLISYGIYSFVKFSRNPELDDGLDAPSLSGTEVLTNEDDILIRGMADGYDEVIVYVDNDEVERVKVEKDSTFEFAYAAEDEGRYAISVSGVKGFPKRYMSAQSDMRIVEVDRTAPELVEIKYPAEVGTETFAVKGVVEDGAEVVVRRGTDKYVAVCDESGEFLISDILLDEGPNVFILGITDKAGNTVEVEERVKITYSVDSDVNGNAVMDEDLPVASGELEAAMRIIRENNLMFIFGLMALLGFMFSSSFVLVKYKGKK